MRFRRKAVHSSRCHPHFCLFAQAGDYGVAFGANSFDFLSDFSAALGRSMAVAAFEYQLEMALGEGKQAPLGSGVDIQKVQMDGLGHEKTPPRKFVVC